MTDINWDALKFLVELTVVLATGVNTAVLFLRKPGQQAAEEVKTLRQHVDHQYSEVHTELAVLRERMENVPTGRELEALAGEVSALTVKTDAMTEAQKTIHSQLNRIENFLLTQK